MGLEAEKEARVREVKKVNIFAIFLLARVQLEHKCIIIDIRTMQLFMI